jgi:hypothetical protein
MAAEHDSKGIARQWNREIEADERRLAAHVGRGPWRRVVWTALWLLWLLALGAVLSLLHPLNG